MYKTIVFGSRSVDIPPHIRSVRLGKVASKTRDRGRGARSIVCKAGVVSWLRRGVGFWETGVEDFFYIFSTRFSSWFGSFWLWSFS